MIRVNPVYKRELVQTSRMKKLTVLLVIFNSLLALFGLFSFYLTFENANQAGKIVEYADILFIYAIITGIEFILILFITPGVTAGAIAGEREKQTMDILLSTTMTPGSIIRGKLFASINLMLILAFSSLPVVAIVFAVGGINIHEIVELMIFLCITAIYIGSIGTFFSTLCKRSTIATVCTYTTLLILTLGLMMVLMGSDFIQTIFSISTNGIKRYSYVVDAPDSYLTLLLNPLFSYASMLYKQAGIQIGGFGSWKTIHPMTYYIFQNWFGISLFIQLFLSAVLIGVSSRILSPHHRLSKNKAIKKPMN